MKDALRWVGPTFSARSRRCGCLGSALLRSANHFHQFDFPGLSPKVPLINVDKAGRDVPLSGQEGNCVQWL